MYITACNYIFHVCIITMFTLYQYTDVAEGTCNLVERVGGVGGLGGRGGGPQEGEGGHHVSKRENFLTECPLTK